MLRRLLLGLLIGLIIGGAVAAGVVKGLGMVTFAVPALAYLLAAATGALTGLIAGKPIWSADGKIEAGLKAFFGALLAAGAMFALRRWVPLSVDLGALGAGQGQLGDLPAAALPIVGAVLGGFFELDNTEPPAEKDAKAAGGKRIGAAGGKVRVGDEAADELDEAVAPPVASAKKKR